MRARVLAVAALLISSVATAQTNRSGFSLSAGAGSGKFEFIRDDLTDRSVVSQAWTVRVEYAHNQRVALGFELDHWSDGAEIKPAFTWYNAVVLGYPFTRGPLSGIHAKALVGLHRYKTRVFNTSELGWGAGLGYELGITKSIAIAAYSDYIVASTANVKSHMIMPSGELRRIDTQTGGKMLVYGLGLKLH